eukprot:CAMPEP_0114145862 /NCGR_PEP_ID=MMETSP0043_2-20121206/20265_1 /TAXON_ID=464988 /ORGANISM="Hemiselmis andersenii, Strain CCMP644" /LENGTH=38 /DNA_ID= /DNA_START= /DNA_END= /DNA_ORIENTATION=
MEPARHPQPGAVLVAPRLRELDDDVLHNVIADQPPRTV